MSQKIPSISKWVIALTVMLPTFIEVMDTSVVNVSLPHIQGSLNAGLDEVTWVLTSYLVSNAVIIPITGWLSSVFGRKRYLLFSLTLFTISSIMCGAAPSLEVLIIFRILQGLGGGGLQPLSQAILLESFPPAEHGIAMAVFGMGVVLAPILGPVVGGWITDSWSWRWVFYINLPIGILAAVLALFFIHDPEYIRRRHLKIDTWGLFLLTVGLGALQIVLDKGEREDWFHSNFIVILTCIAVISLVLFVLVELRVKHPVVNLRVFRNRSFATGTLIMFAGFFCLFGSIVLIPLYLQNLMGYTAYWAGLVLGPGGLGSFFMMAVAGVLMKKGFNPRNLLAIGLAIMAYSLWLMSHFNLETGFYAVSYPRLIQGIGMGLFFVPLSAATYVNIPREETGNASGVFNLLRNLGGSFGVAFSSTVLAQRAQVHQTFLAEHVTPYNPVFQMHSEKIQQWLESSYPAAANQTGVLSVVYREVLRQASMLAFNDTFWLLAIITAVLVFFTPIFKRPKRAALPMEGVH
ncbi:DHA2 family efflux MFS transporter permease subunit [Desulforhabdus amnigena]|jgi:DHA2 family multidrug resistance protein|uniref:EmrB/QacA family drug resistance transporter n=1 Tax=Desulforhabdus amnigena TaxID=40218 RepID=A0A9W6LBB6_9BACT|nr:DHA2 family efflux MFS transporter permease subunit [Desulforhabdus amnigena]NLJ27106.1 DHA2 family efflux MFS transporter permease subunit [Deltaproteobacteria bacterium]GLI36421.1 EmrB/QacA family drug resistance transporter [Desulforhabdus amnigena]